MRLRRPRRKTPGRSKLAAGMGALRHLRLRKRPKARPLWFLRPRLPRTWRAKPGRPVGEGNRSRLKGLWRLALPLLRRLRRPVPAALLPAPRFADTGRFAPLKLNAFTIRLAETACDVEAAQALRYRIFYEERGAAPSAAMRAAGRDFDAYDEACDHLLVLDQEKGEAKAAVVGTYRLLRRSVAVRRRGFYSAQEFDLSPLMVNPGELVELGRSCVDPAYRSRGVLQLLWRGLAAYVHAYDIHLMFGCASFPGTAPDAIAPQLAYLYHYHLAPKPLRPRALDAQYVAMDRLPRSGVDVQAAISALPPLIKGYLRVGGFVGDGAVVDHQFNTTDVCVVVRTDQLTAKYERHYRTAGPDAGRP